MRAVLEILFEDERLARAVQGALKPDDSTPPKGFRLASSVDGRKLTYRVDSAARPPNGVLTLLSILDEVSRLSELVEKAVSAARGGRPR